MAGQRVTDGISLKIAAWSFSLTCGLVAYIYVMDRTAQARYMESITSDVKTIAKQRTVDRQDIEYLKQSNTYVLQAVSGLQDEAKKNSAFRTETRIYWAAKGHGK